MKDNPNTFSNILRGVRQSIAARLIDLAARAAQLRPNAHGALRGVLACEERGKHSATDQATLTLLMAVKVPRDPANEFGLENITSEEMEQHRTDSADELVRDFNEQQPLMQAEVKQAEEDKARVMREEGHSELGLVWGDGECECHVAGEFWLELKGERTDQAAEKDPEKSAPYHRKKLRPRGGG